MRRSRDLQGKTSLWTVASVTYHVHTYRTSYDMLPAHPSRMFSAQRTVGHARTQLGPDKHNNNHKDPNTRPTRASPFTFRRSVGPSRCLLQQHITSAPRRGLKRICSASTRRAVVSSSRPYSVIALSLGKKEHTQEQRSSSPN